MGSIGGVDEWLLNCKGFGFMATTYFLYPPARITCGFRDVATPNYLIVVDGAVGVSHIYETLLTPIGIKFVYLLGGDIPTVINFVGSYFTPGYPSTNSGRFYP